MNIKTLILSLLILAHSSALASKYPKTAEQKEADEIGSLLGGGGISFAPFHSKNESTKDEANNVNIFLVEASKNILNFMPLNSFDIRSGSLITDWYSTLDQPNYSYKVIVNIKSNIISPEAIDVNVHEKKLKNGNWYNMPLSDKLSREFENKILKKARELFINSGK